MEELSADSDESYLHIANIITDKNSSENVPALNFPGKTRNRNGTVVAYDSPKRSASKRSSSKRAPSPYAARPRQRPQSAKSSVRKEEVTHFVQDASSAVITSIQQMLAQKHNELACLSNTDHKELELYFKTKTKDFQAAVQKQWQKFKDAPYSAFIQQRLKGVNSEKERKRDELLLHKLHDEVERKKKANQLQQENQESLLQKELRQHQEKLQREKARDLLAKAREERALKQREKAFIIENINNYYESKIEEIKDAIEQSRTVKKTLHVEKKRAQSAAKRDWKERKKHELVEAKNYYDTCNDFLQLQLEENAKRLKHKLSRQLRRK